MTVKLPSWRTQGWIWLGWILGFLFGWSFDFILKVLAFVAYTIMAQAR